MKTKKEELETKKVLDEKELEKVRGAGTKYTLEAEKTELRSNYERGGGDDPKRGPFTTPG